MNSSGQIKEFPSIELAEAAGYTKALTPSEYEAMSNVPPEQRVLDEIPGAYKDIDVVMENQADLVTPIYELKQVLCVKGA